MPGRPVSLLLIGSLRSQRPSLRLPLAASTVAAGFPSPADDYIDVGIDLNEVLIRHPSSTFFLRVSGDSMVEAHIADGDVVLLEPVVDAQRLKEGTIVSALVPGSGTTLKHFHRQGAQVRLEAANPNYAPILVDAEQVTVQGKLVAVWRQV